MGVEVHNVQTPVLVERKVAIPYDAPFTTTNIVKVPTPVHVDAPYNAPYPVPVQGEPIIKKSVAHAGVTSSVQAAPVVNAAAYAAAPVAAYAAAPAAALVHWAEEHLKTGCVLKQLPGPLTRVTMGFNNCVQ